MSEMLGKKAKCKVTGYTGTITAKCEYLYEDTSVGLKALNEKGEPVTKWFPVKGVEIIE